MTARLALYGFLLTITALFLYGTGVAMAPLRWALGNPAALMEFNEKLVWYSGMPLFAGAGMIGLTLLWEVRRGRQRKSLLYEPISNTNLTVALTAYNDEKSIGPSVKDFLDYPGVKRVIVISNNSSDRTLEFARQAGALAYNETRQGYGACVHRALREALAYNDSELTVLCEGDQTFRASDLAKFLAYAPHGHIVNGSRIVEQLQQHNTQLTMFMHYGNLFVGKLLELKYMGSVTLTDVGTTYKVCRNDALRELMKELNPRVNLSFNPYFLDRALKKGLRIVECPITFHPRIGASKGGNAGNWIACKLGLLMILGILIDWRGFGRD